MFGIISKLKNKRGFTLIELIVVLAVLAIIMAIAVPRFMGIRDDAAKDADESTLASIAKLAELEYVRNKPTSDTNQDITKLVSDNYPEYGEGILFQTITTTSTTKIFVDYDDGYVEEITIGGDGSTGGTDYTRGTDGRFVVN